MHTTTPFYHYPLVHFLKNHLTPFLQVVTQGSKHWFVRTSLIHVLDELNSA